MCLERLSKVDTGYVHVLLLIIITYLSDFETKRGWKHSKHNYLFFMAIAQTDTNTHLNT